MQGCRLVFASEVLRSMFDPRACTRGLKHYRARGDASLLLGLSSRTNRALYSSFDNIALKEFYETPSRAD